MITKTEAVILKSMDYRDSSKIVTFYTRRFGKIKCVAKGARQRKNKFGAGLEPITSVMLVLYKKELRDLQLVSQCDAIKTYRNTHSDLDRMAVALSTLELVNQLVHEEEESEPLYQLLVETLDEIEKAARNVLNLFFAFEIRCAALFGFAPDFTSCSVCGRWLDEIVGDGSVLFQLARGSVVCGACATAASGRPPLRERGSVGFVPKRDTGEGSVRVSVGILKVLHRLLTARLDSIPLIELPASTGNEIDGTLRLYLRQHFEDLKPIKSLEMLKSYSVTAAEKRT
jgi:DNA repair protein RecO (recombination protein O)